MKIYNTSTNPNPEYATKDSAGLDLAAKEDTLLTLGVRTLVKTGIHVEIPKGYFGMLVPRSSLSKRHIYMTNSVGIIDADYRGEILASLIYNDPYLEPLENYTHHLHINEGERIVQLVILPVVKVVLEDVSSLEDLESTERGQNGFGSTGT